MIGRKLVCQIGLSANCPVSGQLADWPVRKDIVNLTVINFCTLYASSSRIKRTQIQGSKTSHLLFTMKAAMTGHHSIVEVHVTAP